MWLIIVDWIVDCSMEIVVEVVNVGWLICYVLLDVVL